MRNVGGLRHAARGSAARNARQNLKDANPKFHAGPNPLELESRMKVIAPTSAQEVAAMTRMLEDAYAGGTTEQKSALEFWKMQIASGTALDEVRFQFLRRFYFWLLGRGEEEDHKKTLWGRGNAAVYNGEVAAYIDQFTSKRAQFAQQLALLADRVPSTLNGYYLYYKYIVNGNLKRVKDPKNHKIEFWDFSDEDYLQDFDLFQQEFGFKRAYGGHRGETAYSEIIAPAMERPKEQRAFEGVDQYPLTRQSLQDHVTQSREKTNVGALDATRMEQSAADGIRTRLSLGKHTRHEHQHMTHDREARSSAAEDAEGEGGAMREESTLAGVKDTNPPQFGKPGAMEASGIAPAAGVGAGFDSFHDGSTEPMDADVPDPVFTPMKDNSKGKEEAEEIIYKAKEDSSITEADTSAPLSRDASEVELDSTVTQLQKVAADNRERTKAAVSRAKDALAKAEANANKLSTSLEVASYNEWDQKHNDSYALIKNRHDLLKKLKTQDAQQMALGDDLVQLQATNLAEVRDQLREEMRELPATDPFFTHKFAKIADLINKVNAVENETARFWDEAEKLLERKEERDKNRK